MKIKRLLFAVLVLVSFLFGLVSAADYCAVETYTCSNGVDDNGDGLIDYSSEGTGDPTCLSPYMSEGASAVSAAPAFEGESFWQKLWNFLIFWK